MAKCGFEITQCDVVPMPIKEAERRPGCPGKMMADPSRTQWNQLCGKEKPYPLQAIPDSLPLRTHCSF